MKQMLRHRHLPNPKKVTETSSVPHLFAKGVDVSIKFTLFWREAKLTQYETFGSIQILLQEICALTHQAQRGSFRRPPARDSYTLLFRKGCQIVSALNLMLHPGHIHCQECLTQIPATFLFCPCCYNFAWEQSQWVALAPLQASPLSSEDYPRLFALIRPEYLA